MKQRFKLRKIEIVEIVLWLPLIAAGAYVDYGDTSIPWVAYCLQNKVVWMLILCAYLTLMIIVQFIRVHGPKKPTP